MLNGTREPFVVHLLVHDSNLRRGGALAPGGAEPPRRACARS